MNSFVIILADCALKSAVVLGVAALATFGLRERSASLRHSIWSAAIIAAVLMPALTAIVPRWREDIRISTITRFSPPLKRSEAVDTETVGGTEIATQASTEERGRPWVAGIWLIGLVCILAFLLREVARFAGIAYRAAPFFESRWFRMAGEIQRRFQIGRSIRLVQSRTSSMLVTWGAVKPRVLLPDGAAGWTEPRMRAVLGHEFAHIRRHDWFIQLVGEIGRAIYWFNPLMWFACDRLRQESERACDDAVLGLGVESTEYAAELLDLARLLKSSSCSWAPSLAMAHASTLERRFAAMLNPSADRRSISRKTAALIAIATLCVVLPVAAMRAPLQTASGRLFGRVYDPNGTPIKNAAITVFDPAKNVRDFTTSNASGDFEFSLLPAGQYELQTSATGFESFQIHSVSVEANQEVNLNILTVAAALPSAVKAPSVVAGVETPAPKPDRTARLVHQVNPVYPANAKSAGVQGVVALAAVVGTDGSPKSLRVVSSGIDPDLAKAAVDAVKQWRWEPATANGSPVESDVSLNVNFRTVTGGVRGSVEGGVRGVPPLTSPQDDGQHLGVGIGVGMGVRGAVVANPGADPGASSSSAQAVRIRQGGNVQQSMLLSQVKPVYPPDAKEARIQGVVILEALIGKDGNVNEVKAISGHPMLQQAAIDAVSQWKYKPTLLNGQPVEVVTTVTVNFSFQQ
jgi:TonB family protein